MNGPPDDVVSMLIGWVIVGVGFSVLIAFAVAGIRSLIAFARRVISWTHARLGPMRLARERAEKQAVLVYALDTLSAAKDYRRARDAAKQAWGLLPPESLRDLFWRYRPAFVEFFRTRQREGN